MKKITPLVIIIISLLGSLQTSAKIWRVNNNPSLNANVLQPSTLFNNTNTLADPEAAAGDSVYLEPSGTAYNAFSVNKTNIVILGYGYFLHENTGFQANTNTSRVSSYIEFLATSTGSSVSGVIVDGQVYCTNVSNILITRCFIQYLLMNAYTANATGIRMDKCFVRYQLYDQSIAAAVTSVTVNIENCIFSDTTNNATTGVGFGNKIRGLLRNNTFNGCGQIYCYNFYIANNIVVGNTNFGNVTQAGNNIYRNNILSYPSNATNTFVTNTLPNSGNIFAQNMAPVFVGTPDNVFVSGSTYNNRIDKTGSTLEGRFDLKAGSPALAAGESGTTFGAATVTTPACGASGATDPYRKGGFPAIPRIYSLTVPPSVSNGAPTMTIAISSSSNN
jgi:putative flippase GtrA